MLDLAQIVRNRFHRTTVRDQLFHPTEEFFRSLSSIVGFDQLVPTLCSKLHEQLRASTVVLVVFEPITNRYAGKSVKGSCADMLPEFNFHRSAKLVRWLNVNMVPLEVARDIEVIEYLSEDERSLLTRADVALVVPLIVVNRLTGALFIGRKTDGVAYRESEIDELMMVANQIALAIEHALMYQFQEDKLKKLFRADSLATIGELAAGAAHEIRNPLTSIRSTVQFLQKDLPDQKKVLVREIIEEVDRIDDIIKGLLSFSRSSELHLASVDITDTINQTLLLLESELRKHNVAVWKGYDGNAGVKIVGDASQLKQVFLNIFLNGIQAMTSGGTLRVSIDGMSSQSGEVVVTIRDSGCGIPEKDLSRVFDPFFTNKDIGTGLGLSISYGIVSRHGGDIEISSRTEGVDRGTIVKIRLPQREGSS
jgi:signal transduction histidine kinase